MKTMAKVAGTRPPNLPNNRKASTPTTMATAPRRSGRSWLWPGAPLADSVALRADTAISTPTSASSVPTAAGKNPGPIWRSVPMRYCMPATTAESPINVISAPP